MSQFEIRLSEIEGVVYAAPAPHKDERGYFERLFCENIFAELGVKKRIVNINHSFSKNQGTVRGLHFQIAPFSETKIIICLKGSIFDVATDIRRGSPTFLKYHSEVLSADKRNMLIIPEGVAHGFQTLEDDVELIYLHTAHFAKVCERSLKYDDPKIGIKWPLDIIWLSQQDRQAKLIDDNFNGIDV